MSATAFSEDQRDALQELTNIAMGQAGASLARLLDEFVGLSIPRISIVEVAELPVVLADLIGLPCEVNAVRQSFQGYLRGEVIVIFEVHGPAALADLMGYEGDLSAGGDTELLLDVANVLAGACLGGLMEQIRTITGCYKADLSFSMPCVLGRFVQPELLIDPSRLTWTHALLLEVNFTLERRNFVAHLVMLLPESGTHKLRDVVDALLASL